MAARPNSNYDADDEKTTIGPSNAIVTSSNAGRSRLPESEISLGDIHLDNQCTQAETVEWLLRTYQNSAKAGVKGDYDVPGMSQVLVKLLKSQEGLQVGDGVIFSLQDEQAERFLDLMLPLIIGRHSARSTKKCYVDVALNFCEAGTIFPSFSTVAVYQRN